MNWFSRLWNNGNFHAVVATLAGAASVVFPSQSQTLQVIAGAFAAPALALPGGSIIPSAAPVVNLPPAVGGGSYHAVDYENLAAALLQQFAPKKK